MTVSNRDEIEIRDLGPDDVPSLIACVRSCYGESYTEPEFYDPAFLRAELDEHRLLSVGALVGGRIVGHVGTRIARPGDSIADTVGGIVDPAYRGRGLTSAMGAHMVSHYDSVGIAGVRHLTTGAHDRTQRLIVASGGVATGVLLGHVASRTDYRGIEHGFGNHAHRGRGATSRPTRHSARSRSSYPTATRTSPSSTTNCDSSARSMWALRMPVRSTTGPARCPTTVDVASRRCASG